MKYFTKFIPVEGEIKEGDMILYKNGDSEHYAAYRSSYYDQYDWVKKVKLFLCTRDIQVGDRAFCPAMQRANEKFPDASINPHFIVNTEEERQSAFDTKSIKVIGEISPDALSYVKEGDEFEESEWKHRFAEPYLLKPEECIVNIKGPCGHFH